MQVCQELHVEFVGPNIERGYAFPHVSERLICISYSAVITVEGTQRTLMLFNSKLISIINLHNQTESYTNISIAKLLDFSLKQG